VQNPDSIDDIIPFNLMIIAASYYNPFVEAVIKTFPMSARMKAQYAYNMQEKHVDIYGRRYYYVKPSMFSEYYKLYEIAVLNVTDAK
jgi:hypothetical protein